MADNDRGASPRRSPSPGRGRSPSPSARDGRRSPSPAKGGAGGSSSSASNPGNNLYIAGLSTRTTEAELDRRFAKYGKVIDCRLVLDPRTKESRGFGFVSMDTPEAAEDAIRGLNRAEVDGRLISVEKAKRGRPRTPTPGTYLGAERTRRGGRDDRGRDRDRDYDRGRDNRDRDGRDRYSSRRSPPRDYRGRSPPRDYRGRSPPREYRRDRSPRSYDSRY